jgi:hypothetical protein
MSEGIAAPDWLVRGDVVAVKSGGVGSFPRRVGGGARGLGLTKLGCWVVLVFGFGVASGAETAGGFGERVRPFFEEYCLSCHDEETKEGEVSLEGLGEISAENAGLWKRIWEQVALKEMPPRKKTKQPKGTERLELSNWITAGLEGAMREKGGFTEHMRPGKGNHLDHDLLFNTALENL